MRLAMVCQHLRLSGAGVARLCGFAVSTWNSWEAGTIPENIALVADHIAKTTGVDRDWLLFGTEDTSRYFPLTQLQFGHAAPKETSWTTPESSPNTHRINVPEAYPTALSTVTKSSIGRSSATSKRAA